MTTARTHFARLDPTMHSLLKSASDVQYPTASKPDEYVRTLASSINSQQISVKAADSIWNRVENTLGSVTSTSILSTAEDDLRSCGLSRQKVRYLKSLAEYAAQNNDLRDIDQLSNGEVVNELTKITGVGQWTAEMFLIFALARPDVFSYGDLGLMRSLEQHYGIHYQDIAAANAIIEPLSPYRTTAALVLWYHKDGGPVLL